MISRIRIPSSTSSWCQCRQFTPRHRIRTRQNQLHPGQIHARSLFNLFSKPPPQKADPKPILSQDNLFHPLSKSPFPSLRERGEAVKSLAQCPVCSDLTAQGNPHATNRHVSFECADCGWPTHCSHEHWEQDKEHSKYCSRLREVNEDEHDLRSGRKLTEFEMPGPIGYEETISFGNWDVFWYTRGFPSMDSERSRRHASKLLTYPITIASALHQYSGLTLSNHRLTPEGLRSLAALRTTLHAPPGSPDTEEAGSNKPSARIFILGARAESSLPVHVWEQLSMLFPSATVHVHFIGPQVSLPMNGEAHTSTESASQQSQANATPASEQASSSSSDDSHPSLLSSEAPTANSKTSYVPNVYQPPTPSPIAVQHLTRSSIDAYNAPSYTTPYSSQMSITGIQSSYAEVHSQFAETYDPYTDCFFLFSPGFGFPSPSGALTESGEPVLQISSPTEWGNTLPLLLQTKCPIFITGFSPVDVERDVRSLSTAPGVAGEFDWIITPGENAFSSEKWEVADFDPRVMVKTNWGIWGIRGKSRDIQEV